MTVDATVPANNALLTLTGSADFVVTGLKGDLAATNVTGALDVTTADVASGLSIATRRWIECNYGHRADGRADVDLDRRQCR